MAILQSCCCWQTVRKGSYASGIYTMQAYFSMTTFITSVTIINDMQFMKGDVTESQTTSFLEPRGISHTTITFYIILLVLSGLGCIASIILIIGLWTNTRFLLIPWIIMVVFFSLADLSHSIYWLTLNDPTFSPITGILFTLELFIFILNIYALLCVISQYQEYKAGRGTAEYNRFLCAVPSIRYSKQTTATSGLSTSRKVTPSHFNGSPSKLSPSTRSSIATDRRHVQFPDKYFFDMERSDFFWCAEEPHFPNENPSNEDSGEPSAEFIRVEREAHTSWENKSTCKDNMTALAVSDLSIPTTSETSSTVPLTSTIVTKL